MMKIDINLNISWVDFSAVSFDVSDELSVNKTSSLFHTFILTKEHDGQAPNKTHGTKVNIDVKFFVGEI